MARTKYKFNNFTFLYFDGPLIAIILFSYKIKIRKNKQLRIFFYIFQANKIPEIFHHSDNRSIPSIVTCAQPPTLMMTSFSLGIMVTKRVPARLMASP
jgi:hypothetical protein